MSTKQTTRAQTPTPARPVKNSSAPVTNGSNSKRSGASKPATPAPRNQVDLSVPPSGPVAHAIQASELENIIRNTSRLLLEEERKKERSAITRELAARQEAPRPLPPRPTTPSAESQAKVHFSPQAVVPPPVQAAGTVRSRGAKVDANGALNRWNLYSQTLDFPEEVMGIRIPDDTELATSCFSLVHRFQLTTSVDGTAGFMIGQGGYGDQEFFMIPNANVYPTTTTKYVYGITTNQANCTSSQPFQNANPGQLLVFPGWSQTAGWAVPNLVSEARLVSMGVSIVALVSTLGDGGVLSGAFMPRDWFYSTYSVNSQNLDDFNVDSLLTIPGAVQVPVSSKKAMHMTYSPTDPVCFQFVPTNGVPDVTDHAEFQAYQPGGFAFIAGGMSAGVKLQVCLTANYEGIPRTNALFFADATDQAPNDPIAVSEAMNHRKDVESVTTGVPAVAASLLTPEAQTATGVRGGAKYHPFHKELSSVIKHVDNIRIPCSDNNNTPEPDYKIPPGHLGMLKLHTNGIRCSHTGDAHNSERYAKDVDQDETLFEKVAKLAIKVAGKVGPDILASIG